ncbi:zinc-dependent alcohol dehydrogenase family protein [Carnobacteriaceae bacterium zg-ZUI78]|uniref:zinc-dependent alcohol dehydrogenase family protein n=1 Tax=Granulicatella sp. zg-84 TaxID=2678503 RepID=UPI0013BEE2A9|nr:zinc-dependent alcohol dehydrogenase family protein [Granulicatella sp. zg-84]MBS4750918.1 zinc-dependent alcohol dehydrogenase family protein [Carnobacteriaceae bacterium zg-ZUI78]NEW65407.1 alcohol dehydrogenase catalytic domain-containing protein [Granulicatella sp. zg-84]QMI85206.1 zinc-dependent alcohol dehydrogenase family protein [Carnobacteriaceae bacterium zg-84]
MKAYTYVKPGEAKFVEKDKPVILKPTDAIVRMVKTTICGTDLHIIKGDVPAVKSGTILGHEGIGVVEEVGEAVTNFKKGDKVLISCVCSCSKCYYCKKGIYAHCEDEGGWIFGHLIDGTQAEFLRVPHADATLYHTPEELSDEALVMLSDILPTGYEIGVLKGKVTPGCTVAIVGSGPVGLASLLTAQFFSPAKIIMIDLDDNRLERALSFGATHAINSSNVDEAIQKVFELTDNRGVDVAIEAVGIPATFDFCQKVIAIDGTIANAGVHGKPVLFDIERLWIHNINITTGLVSTNTTPQLLQALAANKIQPEKLVTHYFKLSEIEEAYEIFGKASEHNAIKVIIENDITPVE